MGGPTFGEKIVRKSYLHTEPADVREAKRLAAVLLDYCYDMMPDKPDDDEKEEELRLFGQAITSFEAGTMWLVKALTVKRQ